MTRGARLVAGALFASLLIALLAPAAASDTLRAESTHFVITHESEASPGYVALVTRGLETAYETFVTQAGFATFPARVDVRILPGEMDGMGAEYLDEDEDGQLFPVIEIASRQAMLAAAESMWLAVSLEDAVLSTTAHEFFHVVQDYASLYGHGDIEEVAFVEPHATAVQEIVAPRADDYLDAAVDFLAAPDAMPFLDRGYDAGLFWVYVLDRYGLDAVRRVMTESAVADGARAIDRAFAPFGLTFLDVWAKFAAAWASGNLPDPAALAETSHAWRAQNGGPGFVTPPPCAVARWDGQAVKIERTTEDERAEPLRVETPYGIDAVAIRVHASDALRITVRAAASAGLRVAWVGRRGERLDLLGIGPLEITVSQPNRYDEVRVVLTRGETPSGRYTLELSPAS